MTGDAALKVSWLTALALGAGLGLSSPAEACSGLVCEPGATLSLPAQGPVPANVPALVLRPETSGIISQGANGPRLLRADGSAVPVTLVASAHGGPVLVAPEAPLEPGETYRLEALARCDLPEASRAVQASFTVGPALPLPSATGALRVEAADRGLLEVAHGGFCTIPLDAASVRFHFTPAPELVPFLPWVQWRLEVDGNTWATARHGAIGATGALTSPSAAEVRNGARHLLRVHADCSGSSEALDKGLAPGKHRAMLRPELASAHAPVALPPLELDFELTCVQGQPPGPETPAPQLPALPEEVRPAPHGCTHAGGASLGGLLAVLARGLLGRRRRG
jgi:hypothetical protein